MSRPSDPFGFDPERHETDRWGSDRGDAGRFDSGGDDDPPELADRGHWSAPRRRRPMVVVVALLLVVALALGATSLFWSIVSPAGRAQSDGPAMGDCLAVDGSGTYRVVSCGDAAASLQVLAPSVDREGCVGVPGVSTALRTAGGYLCLGVPGVDRARALNAVVRGACVIGSTASSVPFQRSPCDAGALPVLAVVGDVPTSAGESTDDLLALCRQAGAANVAQTYGWSIADPDQPDRATWDRLLCLGASA